VVRIPRGSLSSLPQPNSPIITSTDELPSRRTPIRRHGRSDVTFVDLSRRREVAHVEGVEVVIFGGAEEDGRLEGVEDELVDAHLEEGKERCQSRFQNVHLRRRRCYIDG
jgi:hypothetical protein